MAIAIRPGTLESDRLSAVELLSRHLNPAYDAARFDWLHTRNPAGPGRFWIAFDSATGETVGTAAAFPRLFTIAGREERGWVLGDFCVSARHRSLGPALKLQRLCLDLATDSGTPFCYDFPSRAMMTVYQRLRIPPRAEMRRLVKLLSVQGRLAALGRLPRLAGGLGRILDRVLAFRSRFPSRSDLSLDLHVGHCGEEFSQLAESEGASYGICLKRSAAYLNWRYRENPTARYEILTARRQGRLVGYAVFGCDPGGATLTDLFGVQDETVLSVLVRAVTATARQRGCASLGVALIDSHPWVAMFCRLGFVRREVSPLVLSASADSIIDAAVPTTARLFLMAGDRDS